MLGVHLGNQECSVKVSFALHLKDTLFTVRLRVDPPSFSAKKETLLRQYYLLTLHSDQIGPKPMLEL